ncbi:conserved hypothetical protein [Candidatus Sulfopaludibacter sp. SbA4]|nr:conserved hypothetical protein [Candidatus Sulfopaludibacter sp. SbA4]
MIGGAAAVKNPYPGLRPFEPEDSGNFFGRDRQVDELLLRLRDHRFVAVLGLSGSGKSSLVRAGLVPALKAGHLISSGARWRIALFRPGSQPVDSLAAALDGALGVQPDRAAQLRKSSNALLLNSRAGREASDSLLVVVDQFEEIFRMAGSRDAARFVDLLLAAEQDFSPTFRVYVVLTMRTDRLGECAEFEGLPEALNRSQYLVPRLTGDELREAMEGPAALTDTEIAPELVQRLVIEAAEGRDQLPLLQHLLMTLWEDRETGGDGSARISLDQFERVKSAAEALNEHADRVLAALPENRQALAGGIFRALTDVKEGRDQRRPQRIGRLAEVTGTDAAEVRAVVEHFYAADFLTSPDRGRTEDWEVDITHESLIRQWKRLSGWVAEEAKDAEEYRYFAQRAQRHAGALTGTDLGLARTWAAKTHNAAWAVRYGGDFEQTVYYIRRSRLTGAVKGGFILLAVAAIVVMAIYAWRSSIQANQEKRRALSRSAIQDGALLFERHPELAAAYMVRALRIAPDSVAAASWISDLLLNHTWWVPGAPLHHQAEVCCAAFSPDGRRVVTASWDHTAQVWEADTGKPVGAPLQHQDKVNSAAFSPDGRRVVTASDDKTARVWEAGSGKPVGAPLRHQNSVVSAAFSPDGRRVVTASEDRTAQVWEAETGKPVGAPLRHQEEVNSAVFSPDGRRVVTASDDKTAQVWEADTGRPVGPTLRHQATVFSAAFSPDGRRVVTASEDHTARVWEADTGKPVNAPLQHQEAVYTAAFSPDGRRVVTASEDDTARVWEADTGKPLSAPLQHQDKVISAAFSPNGRLVVTASDDHTAQVWEADTGKPVGAPLQHQDKVRSAAFSPDGRRVVTASFDKTARVWAEAGKPVGALLQHQDKVISAAFSPDGRRVVTASDDHTARVWEADTGKPVGAPLQHRDKVNSAAFSPDGRRVVTASDDNTARVWEADTGKPVGAPLQHQDKVMSAAFSPDGRRVVTASEDDTAQVWEAETSKPVGPPLQHSGTVFYGTFSPDGRRVVTASADLTARVWEAETSKPVGPPLQHSGTVYFATFSPDGRRVVTASLDKTAQVWEADTGRSMGKPLQHHGTVLYATFSPDGRRVVTASADLTARVWEADTGKPVGAPMQHQGEVYSAALSPDGRRVVTASYDHTARVWETDTGMPLGAPLQHQEAVYSATFSPDGRRVVTASEDHTARVWSVLLICCASPQESDRLAGLAEAVSGYQVSDTGSLSFIGLDKQREHLEALGRSRGTSPPPVLSLEWLIDQFSHNFRDGLPSR